jgi:hypothetical protein
MTKERAGRQEGGEADMLGRRKGLRLTFGEGNAWETAGRSDARAGTDKGLGDGRQARRERGTKEAAERREREWRRLSWDGGKDWATARLRWDE